MSNDEQQPDATPTWAASADAPSGPIQEPPQPPYNPPVYGPGLQPAGSQVPLGPTDPGVANLRPAAPATLPVVASNYPNFWRTPFFEIWRPVVALILTLVLGVVASMVTVIPMLIDNASGRQTFDDIFQNGLKITPGVFIGNNVGLALLVPIAWLISNAIFKQKRGWLASVAGSMRWRWMGICFGIMVPLWLLYTLVTWLIDPSSYDGLAVNSDTAVMIVGILLTTPFQCAGEEYGFRALINRAVASFVRPDSRSFPLGPVLGAVVSSLAFMGVHFAGDIWLNIFYFSFGLIACYLTWRTGGLEAAIAMHITNNLLAESTLPFADFSNMFDRQAGTADASVLVMVVVPIVAALIVTFVAKKKGIAQFSTPDQTGSQTAVVH